ncbi:hypothetical protein WMY93_006660 [Mugilogobius chulae]|uniref:IF rod domain-containing protein n=1 Tax=Mugilogobius chulae TaxID=88201 RepID=A0AAW0PL64_9GOBI
MQIEGLKERLIFLKKNHEEVTCSLEDTSGWTSYRSLEVKPAVDLGAIMEEMRDQYERDAEKTEKNWKPGSHKKQRELDKQVIWIRKSCVTSKSEISDLRRKLQALQIELQSQLSLKASLEEL